MSTLVVVENARRWPFALDGVEVVSARDYLTHPPFSTLRRARVYNFCRDFGYQSVGYYVSLLAAARGHKPLPSVDTIQDLRLARSVRMVSPELERLIQQSLRTIQSPTFELSIYFGRNLAKRHDRLSNALFNQFPVPLLRADFERDGDRWSLERIRPIAAGEVPDHHRDFVIEQAQRHFGGRGRSGRNRRRYRYDLAILVNPQEVDAPSDFRAIQAFVRAGRSLGIDCEVIGREDYGRIAEFDALFIRETTRVNHHTYRFARRAAAEGMVVIDDPESIVRCTNKVYLAELFARSGIRSPPTMVVSRANAREVAARIGFPCVLKKPDSSFSRGVVRVEDAAGLKERLAAFFKESDLVIVQGFISSSFDWRVGILDRKPLYACRYYMAPGHWQIQTTDARGRRVFGRYETLPVEEAPAQAVKLALKSAHPIGDGLYGVDIKECDGRFYVMEVNDNPSIESDVEDRVLKQELYVAVMRSFLHRLEHRGRRAGDSHG